MGEKLRNLQVPSWVYTLTGLIMIAIWIQPGHGGRPPKILEHPVDSVVPKNEPVTLNCRAEGDPQPEISWYKDGKIIRLSDPKSLRNVLPTGSLFFLRVRKDQDAGIYYCIARNPIGEVMSKNATLDVATLRDEFRASPHNTWVAQGETAVLECEPPRGNPEPKVSWKKNGNPIDVKGNGRYKIVGLGSLSLSQVRISDEGRYSCVAKNIVGFRTSNIAVLRVTVRPQFTIMPSNTSVMLGSDVSLACVARGDPPPEISWKLEHGAMPLKRAHFDEERLLITNVTETDAGTYICMAENKAGSIQASATVTVLSPPKLVVVPQNIELQPKMTAYFGCEAGGEPQPLLFWSREDSHSLVFQGSSAANSRVTPEGTLQIENITENDEAYYMCAAVSPAGSAIQRVRLKVTPLEELPPPIIQIGPADQSRPVGSVAVMPCMAEGNPAPMITWYKNGESFLLNHRIYTDDAGTLRINDLTQQDAGMYECVASSRSGKYVWRAYLRVEQEPDPTAVFSRTGLDMATLRPREPLKPQIVKVDATSVTIAWHPRYFENEPDVLSSSFAARNEFNSHPFVLASEKKKVVASFGPAKSSGPAKRPTGDADDDYLDDQDKESAEEDDILMADEHPMNDRQRTQVLRQSWVKRDLSDDGDTPRAHSLQHHKKVTTSSILGADNDDDIDLDGSRESRRRLDSGGEDEEEEEDVRAPDADYGKIPTVIDGEDDEEEDAAEIGEEHVNSNNEETTHDNNLIIQSERPLTHSHHLQKFALPYAPTSSASYPVPTTTSTTTTTTSTPRTTSTTTTSAAAKPENYPPSPSQPMYKVEYYSADEVRSEWLLGATNIPSEIFTFHHLKPNTEYIFFVRSISGDGLESAPSPVSDPITTFMTGSKSSQNDLIAARNQLQSSVVVILKQAYPTSPTNIKIEWQIVNAGDFVEGFYIYFRQVENKDEGSYQMLTVLNAGASSFQIVGLEKYTTYQIFLLPFYKSVDGRPSNYLNVTTMEDVPSAPPELVETIPVNTSAVVARWRPPPARHQNGIILGYQLRLWSGSSMISNVTVNGSTESTILTNLSPGHSYSLQIGSFTSKGVGQFTPMKTLNFRPDLYMLASGGGSSGDTETSPRSKSPNRPPKGSSAKNSKVGYDGQNINYGAGRPNENNLAEDVDVNESYDDDDVNGIISYGGGHAKNSNVMSEGWFVGLLGSCVFVVLLAVIVALFVRRCQLRKDTDKFKVSTTEIPDGSMPPHYAEADNLWIDPQKHLAIKAAQNHDLADQNEYANANTNNYAYAVVDGRHSPTPYATTTLLNGEKHKSSFSVFSEPHGGMSNGHMPRPSDFVTMNSSKVVDWNNGLLNGGKTGSLNIFSSDKSDLPRLGMISRGIPGYSSARLSSTNHGGKGKINDDKDGFAMPNGESGKGNSKNVLSTFQTPLPTRKHLIVDFSKGQSINSILQLQSHESRLNSHHYSHSHNLSFHHNHNTSNGQVNHHAV